MTSGNCPECGRPATVAVAEHVVGDGLRWSRSWRCGHCGRATEEDGHGLAPVEVRDRLLATGGEWTVTVDDRAHKVKALAAVRQILNLEMREVGALLREEALVLRRGTRGECTWLQRMLEDRGISGKLTRAS